MAIYTVKLRAKIEVEDEEGNITEAFKPELAGAVQIAGEQLGAMKMPRAVAARLLISKLFEDVRDKVAEEL